jgi:hypothetical protein
MSTPVTSDASAVDQEAATIFIERAVEDVENSVAEEETADPVALETLARMARKLESHLQPGADKQVQEELGKVIALMTLVPRIDGEIERHAQLAETTIAVNALLQDPPNTQLAHIVRHNLEARIPDELKTPFETKAKYVVWGLGFLFYSSFLAFLFVPSLRQLFNPLGPAAPGLAIAAVAGAFGSVASLLVRINDFDRSSVSKQALLFTGLFKPIVGMLFSMFLYAVLAAGLLPLAVRDAGKLGWFQMAAGFAAGFSERLVPDLVADVENSVTLQIPSSLIKRAKNRRRTEVSTARVR